MSHRVRYRYDSLSRLVEACYEEGPTVTYSYDQAGNLASVVSTGAEGAPAAAPVPDAPAPSAEAWFYLAEGKETGPVSREQLEGLLATGRLSPATFVWRAGMSEWRRAGEVGIAVGAPGGAAPPGAPARPIGHVVVPQPRWGALRSVHPPADTAVHATGASGADGSGVAPKPHGVDDGRRGSSSDTRSQLRQACRPSRSSLRSAGELLRHVSFNPPLRPADTATGGAYDDVETTVRRLHGDSPRGRDGAYFRTRPLQFERLGPLRHLPRPAQTAHPPPTAALTAPDRLRNKPDAAYVLFRHPDSPPFCPPFWV